jgi:hypothetical protein
MVPVLQHLGVYGGEGRNPGSIAKQVESLGLLHCKKKVFNIPVPNWDVSYQLSLGGNN